MKVALVDFRGQVVAVVEFVMIPMGLSEPLREREGRDVRPEPLCVNPRCLIHGARSQRPDSHN